MVVLKKPSAKTRAKFRKFQQKKRGGLNKTEKKETKKIVDAAIKK